MARSDASLLRKALEEGDLETAKAIAEKIEKKQKAKTKTKAKAKSRRKVSPRGDIPPDEGRPSIIVPGSFPPPLPVPQPLPVYATGDPDPSWAAPARGQHTISDGRTRLEGRRVSMAGRQHVNIFEQWIKGAGRGADQLDESVAMVEKVISQNTYQTPRPGTPGAKRPVAQKVLTYCGGCGRPFEVYPSEIMVVDAEGEYKCDRCSRRGR
jgi:hypothetical protein